MFIGFDIDDVLVDTYSGIVNTAKFLYNIDITYHPRDFSVLSRYLTREQLDKVLNYCLCSPNIVQPNQECVNLIRELKEKGIQDRFVFITRRPSFLERKTIDFIGEFLPSIDWHIHFAPGDKTKADYVLEEGVTHYIEDRFKYAIQLSEIGTQVFLRRRTWKAFRRARSYPNIHPFSNWDYVRSRLNLL